MRKLTLFAASVGFLLPALALSADLKITDTSGNISAVKNVRIDYTRYDFVYTPDFESSGIRVLQGDAKVIAKWEKIEKVTIKAKDTSKIPWTLKAEIIMKAGDKKEVTLVIDSKKGLTGETDLGDISIYLENLKTIEVAKP